VIKLLTSRLWAALAGLLLWGVLAANAYAVPSFARQTGWDCTQCHMSWLELTNIGRRFKLGGYQVTKAMSDDEKRPLISFSFDGPAPQIPLAAMAQISVTNTANTKTAGTDEATDFPKNNALLAQQLSLFLNGKLAENVGCFCQLTYDGAAKIASVDNIEVRYADEFKGDKLHALYGLSMNNSPTMSDIYNTTPVWGWPYAGPTVAPTPSAATLINGGLAQQVVGFSAYSLLNRTFYVEGGGYRTADQIFRFMSAGVRRADRGAVDGVAPYYRLALQQDWGKGGRQSAMLGTFGLNAKKYPDNLSPSGPTDRFRDVGFDAQYQYITDEHRFSTMYTYIREHQDLNATFASGGSSQPRNTLTQTNVKASYYYDKWYGISVGAQRTTGSSDQTLYNTASALSGSANGSPNSAARIVELNWLFSFTGAESYRTQRLVLQYTSYSKFNGGKTNYDGFGRNAKDNNTLYLLAWLMY
jgi:hypothetical protein